MPIIFWKDKQTPLAAEEVDGNFKDLDDRLKTLEENQNKVNVLASIKLNGSDLIFEGTNGTQFPPIKMPQIFWNPCGLWKKETQYSPFDITQYGSCLYMCKQFHISAQELDNNFWQMMFSLPPSQFGELTENPKLGDIALLNKSPVFYNGENWVTLAVVKKENPA